MSADLRERVERVVRGELGDDARVVRLEPLAGGSSHEAWLLDVEGPGSAPLALVLRRSMGGSFNPLGLDRRAEFAVLRAAVDAGVPAPRVRWYADDLAGRAGFAMDRIAGESVGRKIVADPELGGGRERLAREMAGALAAIHAVPLDALPAELPRPGLGAILDRLAADLDALHTPHPALELGLRWLVRHRPADAPPAFVHGDFRMGNVIVGPDGLRAVLDWEFAHIGDPDEDLGWMSMRAWRFGADALRAAGLVPLDGFLAAYERASGRRVDRARVRWWEVLGNVRWALGAIGQGRRHLDGVERSVELASIGRLASEMEYETLDLVAAG